MRLLLARALLLLKPWPGEKGEGGADGTLLLSQRDPVD